MGDVPPFLEPGTYEITIGRDSPITLKDVKIEAGHTVIVDVSRTDAGFSAELRARKVDGHSQPVDVLKSDADREPAQDSAKLDPTAPQVDDPSGDLSAPLPALPVIPGSEDEAAPSATDSKKIHQADPAPAPEPESMNSTKKDKKDKKNAKEKSDPQKPAGKRRGPIMPNLMDKIP